MIGSIVVLGCLVVGVKRARAGHANQARESYSRRPSERKLDTSHANPMHANQQVVLQSPMNAAQPQMGGRPKSSKSPWVKGVDPKTQRNYWHNSVTGESTWFDPTAVSM